MSPERQQKIIKSQLSYLIKAHPQAIPPQMSEFHDQSSIDNILSRVDFNSSHRRREKDSLLQQDAASSSMLDDESGTPRLVKKGGSQGISSFQNQQSRDASRNQSLKGNQDG
jgi:hypothetical protein